MLFDKGFDNSVTTLSDFKPGQFHNPKKDRLRVRLSNGETVTLMYENRSDYIKNNLHHREVYWVDPRCAPKALKEWALPIQDQFHAGFAASVKGNRQLEFTLVSQVYIGQVVTVGTVVAISSVRNTWIVRRVLRRASALSYIEKVPIRLARLKVRA